MTHAEFVRIEMATSADAGWETPSGYPRGVSRRVLHSDLDETRRTGRRTHLLRFEPGAFTTEPAVHPHWEEVLLVAGDLTDGGDARGPGGTAVQPLSYVRRAPGEPHGPFSSQHGCVLLEIHYFDTSALSPSAERPPDAAAGA